MKVAVTLAPNQHSIIVQLSKLDDGLGELLDYVNGLEDAAITAGNKAQADQFDSLAQKIQAFRSEIEGDELKIVDDSPALKKALSQIMSANKKIAAATKQTADLDAALKAVASIIGLVSQALTVFAA
jgi:hypothetical protein